MMFLRRNPLILAVLALLIVALGYAALPSSQRLEARSAPYQALAPHLETAAERGIATFAFGDWGSLTTDTLRVSASPWKLSIAAMTLAEADGDPQAAAAVDVEQLFNRFGFLSPATLANWPDHLPEPTSTTPLGQNVGTASRIWPPIAATIGNIGCAGCHSGVTYDETGAPDPSRVWLGSSNSSINLELYTTTLFDAFVSYGDDPDLLIAAVVARFPDTTWQERLTLRRFIIPQVQSTVAERNAAYGRFLPFRASLAGATNGLDSLRNRNGLIAEGEIVTESIFNSVPDLGGRLWRIKLLNSGSYAIPGAPLDAEITAPDITDAHRLGLAGIIAYFTVPSMGVSPEVAEAHIDDALDITAWMAEYTPQPYPGQIAPSLAAMGQTIYARDCASCHGTYDNDLSTPQLIEFPNWEGDVGTDPQRARLLTQDVADSVNGGLFGQYISARTITGYTAPPLSGLWSSAPYFHNGSVPTVWQVLRPGERPATFFVGGHRVDLEDMGIELAPPTDHTPWATPVEINTTAFGLSNSGHTYGADLSDTEARALLEYLKLL